MNDINDDDRIVAIEVTPMWAGDLPREEVDTTLKAHGVPDKLLPDAPSRAKCMARALTDLAPRGARIDPLAKGLGVTMSLKNAAKLDLDELAKQLGMEVRTSGSYNATLTAKVFVQNVNGTEIEELQFTPHDHPMVPVLRELYQLKRGQYKASEDLSVWFSQKVIPAVNGVGKRSRGGMYYVPATNKQLLLRVRDALATMSQSDILHRKVNGLDIPVHRLSVGGKLCLEPRYVDDAAAMEILIDGIIREADNAIDKMNDAIDQNAVGGKAKPLGRRALGTKRNDLESLESQIERWEETTSMSLDLLRDRLQATKDALTMAELQAEYAATKS